MSTSTPLTGAELDAAIDADARATGVSDRAHSLYLACNSYACCIADDVAAGREPWAPTVAKYRRARHMYSAAIQAHV